MNSKAAMILGVYVHHLFALAKSVRDGCDLVFLLAPIPEKDGYIKVSPELHARIDSVLIDAANLKKLVRTSPTKGKSESERTFRFRRLRTKLLAEYLSGLKLDAISEVKVRNSLEHFHEHLDKLGARLEAGEPPPQPVAAYNLAFSSWAVPLTVANARCYPLRVYVANERSYYNFEVKVDLGLLREEASAILDRILASGALGTAPEPGGLMVYLRDSK